MQKHEVRKESTMAIGIISLKRLKYLEIHCELIKLQQYSWTFFFTTKIEKENNYQDIEIGMTISVCFMLLLFFNLMFFDQPACAMSLKTLK